MLFIKNINFFYIVECCIGLCILFYFVEIVFYFVKILFNLYVDVFVLFLIFVRVVIGCSLVVFMEFVFVDC